MDVSVLNPSLSLSLSQNMLGASANFDVILICNFPVAVAIKLFLLWGSDSRYSKTLKGQTLYIGGSRKPIRI